MEKHFHQRARPEQIPFQNPDTRVALFMGGRGTGKNFSASNWLAATNLLQRPGLRLAILSPSYTAGWDTALHGPKSGLLTQIPDKNLFKTKEKKYEVEFANGSYIRVFSGEQPTHMRGPEFHMLWLDEVADIPHAMKSWNIIRPAIRLRHPDGQSNKTYVTGTPEATELMVHLWTKANGGLGKDPDPKYEIKTGKTSDNADNLDPDLLEDLYNTFAGTRFHKEQLEGVLLLQAAGALWSLDTIGACQRAWNPDIADNFDTLAFGVDPAVSADKNADETGLIVGGRFENNAYIIGDHSLRASPLQWFKDLVRFSERHGVHTWVYESNLAGPLIRDVGQRVLDETGAAIRLVPVHARGRKQNRAEPVAALYEAAKVLHMPAPGLSLDKLEAQMTQWSPADRDSPDRIDALVHLVKYLLFKGGRTSFLRASDIHPGRK